MSDRGHTAVEALQALDDERAVYQDCRVGSYDWTEVLWSDCGRRHVSFRDPSGTLTNGRTSLCDDGFAIEGCTDGPDGGPCEWCRSCPHLDAGREYGDYVWFEVGESMHGLIVVNNAPIRSIGAGLYLGSVRADPEHLNRVVGFEFVCFAREVEDGKYVAQHRAWEQDVRLDDEHLYTRGALEEVIDREDASENIADYAIFRRT